MSELRTAVQDYLSLRRALGYKLEREGILLPDFVTFLEKQGCCFVTIDCALEWARMPAGASSYWWAKRLGMVRRFAQHMRAFNIRTEVPPADLIPYKRSRRIPYVYADADIQAIMQASERLQGPLNSATYATLVGLLAVSGIRIGEAIAIDRSDLNENQRVLAIRHGKFGKSRDVPLHRTTVEALRSYARKRDHIFPRLKSPSFFVSNAGTRLWSQNVWRIFDRLRNWAGIALRPRPPRVHDLRHTFAIKTLIRWYRDGVEVQPRLASLSTFLGHVNPSSTYWYLTGTPELLGLAAQRLEDTLGDLP